ncbi:MAG TPA: anti-sigma factor [Ornithinibacter sp.]|nr:anti-sigma factor [Ornithinibacter sp.]
MHPDDVALVDLVTGQPVTPRVSSHVATCPQCADELAVLNDVLGLVREPAPELLPVPQRVWDAGAAGIDAHEGPATAAGAGTDPVGGTASDELAARRARRGRGRVAVGWVVGAAAAGLVLGGVGARLLEGEDPPPAGVTLASTSLATLDTGETMGSADVVRHDRRVDLDVRTGPMDPEDGYLEVWLINRDLKRMVSVGVLRPGEADQSFTIPQELLDQGYVIVDISREGFDDKPEHSGDSIVRGDLAT